MQANQGTQNLPEQPRSGYPSNQRKTQPRGRGNRPQYVANRGGRGRFPKPKQQSVNTVSERVENSEYRDFGNDYTTNNFYVEEEAEDYDTYFDNDNTDDNLTRAYNEKGNMFL